MNSKLALLSLCLKEIKESNKTVEVILRGACEPVGASHVKSIDGDIVTDGIEDYFITLENASMFFVSDIVALKILPN